MGALAGFIFGYYLGVKQGPDGYDKLRSSLDAVLASPEVKALLERVPILMSMTGGGGGGSGGAKAEDRGERAEVKVGDQLAATFRAIAESDAVQSAVAGGINFARGLVERGLKLSTGA